MEDKKILLDNIAKIHTTEMGVDRIKRNLKIDTVDVVEYCKNKMLDKNCNIYKQDVYKRQESITGKKVTFYEADCCDEAALAQIFAQHKIDAAIHFAGYKAVGESVAKPLMYYQNNLMSTLALCKVMAKHNCKRCLLYTSLFHI